MFPPIEYLEWMHSQAVEPDGDLGTSGLGTHQTEMVPESLQGLADPPAETTLESLIAAQYDDAVTADNVLVTAGTSHANVLAYAAAMGLRDGTNPAIAVEQPAYEPLLSTPETMGAAIQRVEREPDADYELTAEALEAAIDESTALVVMSNRHNPSGHLTSRSDLETLAERASDAGTRLLVDEVYAPYVPEARTGDGTAFGGPTAAGLEGAVVTTSLTKFLGFGGLRIGWLVADEAFVERAAAASAHLPDVATPSRELARRVFANVEALAADSRSRVAENSRLLAEFVSDREDLEGVVPDGSTFGFVGHSAVDGDRLQEAAQDREVLVVPGRYYEDTACIRLSASGAPENMRAALDTFGTVLDSLATAR